MFGEGDVLGDGLGDGEAVRVGEWVKVGEAVGGWVKVSWEVGLKVGVAVEYIEKKLAEKAFGTVHFAIGDSYGIGKNKSKFHFDALVDKVTIRANGTLIAKDGKFLI